MFFDQIMIMSVIFYINHVYGGEIFLPNVSLVKQYRLLKLNSFRFILKFYSFSSFSHVKNDLFNLRDDFLFAIGELIFCNNTINLVMPKQYNLLLDNNFSKNYI